ncbi:FMRFamide receptor-like [Tubulanus polymorphus]|uniref:FMRFamide receptor-like n=1 Tax=Tubulanus polymorphus TaxID=672921 RepID=UPI003DA67593
MQKVCPASALLANTSLDDGENLQPMTVDATIAGWEWIGYLCICGPICCIGFVCNILSIVVLQIGRWRMQLGGSSTFLLQILALADNYVLVMVFLSKTLEIASRWHKDFASYGDFFRLHLAEFNGFFDIAKTYEVLLVASITTTRFVGMFWPLRTVRFRRTRPLLIMCFALLCYTVIFCLPRFFEFKLEECFDIALNKSVKFPAPSSLLHDKYYHAVYYGIDCIINILLPIALVAILNPLIIFKLRKMRYQSHDIDGRSRTHNVTVYLVAIASMFTVLMLTSFVTTIMVLHDLNLETSHVDVKAVIVGDVMFTINCSINFLIYLAVGRSFRATLGEIFRCTRKRKPEVGSGFHNPMSMTSTSTEVLY